METQPIEQRVEFVPQLERMGYHTINSYVRLNTINSCVRRFRDLQRDGYLVNFEEVRRALYLEVRRLYGLCEDGIISEDVATRRLNRLLKIEGLKYSTLKAIVKSADKKSKEYALAKIPATFSSNSNEEVLSTDSKSC